MTKYLVKDPEDQDRIYTVATHGFDFELHKGKTEEVNEAEMKLLKKVSPYLEFEKVKVSKEEKVFGRPIKLGKKVK